MRKSKPVITIVGVPNTGKSTLFNRLTQTRKALIHADPGMTRDVHNGTLDIEGQEYQLQDTGGVFTDQDVITLAIKNRVLAVSKESDLILFLFDGRRELLGYEEDLYLEIKKMGKPILCVANKADNPNRFLVPSSYYKLNDDFVAISAEHGHNIDVLLDRIGELLTGSLTPEEDQPSLKIGMIGKPNVGKSSLVNAIFQDEVAIVSEIPGTTRDSLDLEIKWHGKKYIIVDNAGIRKMQKVKESTESAAVIRAIRLIKEVDVIIYVVDISKKLDQTDLYIAKKIEESHKPVIIAGNKWDLVPNKVEQNFYHERLFRQLYRFHYAPLILTSALENKHVLKILSEAYEIFERLQANYKAQDVTRIIKEIVSKEKYKTMNGEYFSPKYAAVETTRPFFFVFSCTKPDHLKPAVEIHFKKKLSETFKLMGIPIFIKIMKSSTRKPAVRKFSGNS